MIEYMGCYAAGFSRKKKFVPRVEDINFFEVDPPWISSQIYREPPGISFFFCIYPLESMFFP